MQNSPGHRNISVLVGDSHHHEDLGHMLLLHLQDEFFGNNWQLQFGMTGG